MNAGKVSIPREVWHWSGGCYLYRRQWRGEATTVSAQERNLSPADHACERARCLPWQQWLKSSLIFRGNTISSRSSTDMVLTVVSTLYWGHHGWWCSRQQKFKVRALISQILMFITIPCFSFWELNFFVTLYFRTSTIRTTFGPIQRINYETLYVNRIHSLSYA